MRPTTLAIAILFALPIQLQAGTAGCGTSLTLEAASKQAAAVFVGRAGTVSPTSDDVTFDVDWQWKGNPMPAIVKVSVSGSADLTTSAASRVFQSGRRYLVFTTNSFDPFVVDACGPHQSYVADGSVIPPNLWEPLGASEPSKPDPVPVDQPAQKAPSWTLLGASALGAVTLLLLLRWLYKWRARRKSAGPKQFRMSRTNRAWLAEQEKIESAKPTFAERELQKQRKTWRKKRDRRRKAAAKTATKERTSVES
ncbi:MAG: hypothetical protein HKN91_16745 [Acidimicrobiia bacterium]|nr:hypothetical protein [Acidimicrobiia bacterium]